MKPDRSQSDLPRKSFGQNFLMNENVAKRIVKSLDLSDKDIVLEIGAGKGALTKHLLTQCQRVIAVEIDQRWCRYLADEFSGVENLLILNQDVLKLDLKRHAQKERMKVVGNIPYHLTSPIISFLVDNRNLISQALLTVQKEVANRICAKPDTADWSLLSVFTQLHAKTELLFVLEPSWFYPSPKVHSAVVELIFLEGLAVEVRDTSRFFEIARMMFQQKRKMILNSLVSGLNISKQEIKEKLEDVNIDYGLRPQSLDLEQLAIISSILG